jgi:hypothetical protein
MKKIFVTIWIALLATNWCGARASAEEPAATSEAEQKRLFREGARLWPLYCNTCHNARPGSEKASYEWDQIIMHMRSLGNIPEEDAEAIKVYLKAH